MPDGFHDRATHTLAAPSFPALFRQLDELARVAPQQWEDADFDPLSGTAIAVAGRVLRMLADDPHHELGRVVQAVDLHASRDGGIVVIAGNPEREVELAIGPEGEIDYLLVDLRETDPDKRYLREGEIEEERFTGELVQLFA